MDKKTQFKIHHQANNFINIDFSDDNDEYNAADSDDVQTIKQDMLS